MAANNDTYLSTLDEQTIKNLVSVIPPGQFMFEGYMDRHLSDIYNAVTESDSWDFLRNESPPEGTGFKWWDHPKKREIESKMKLLNDHSGASFACCMRAIEFIAKNSWNEYIRDKIDNLIYDNVTKYDQVIKDLLIKHNILMESIHDVLPPSPPVVLNPEEDEEETQAQNEVNISAGIDLLNRAVNSINRDASQQEQLLQFADLAEESNLPDAQVQAGALRSFANGEMDYARMRSLCG